MDITKSLSDLSLIQPPPPGSGRLASSHRSPVRASLGIPPTGIQDMQPHHHLGKGSSKLKTVRKPGLKWLENPGGKKPWLKRTVSSVLKHTNKYRFILHLTFLYLYSHSASSCRWVGVNRGY